MGDSTDSNDEEYSTRRRLKYYCLDIDDESFPWISDHIDCFVSQSRGNESVEQVGLYSCLFTGQDDTIWDKVAQAIGNFQALGIIWISPTEDHENSLEARAVAIRDWERLACILRHVRHKVEIRFIDGRLDTLYSTLATPPALESITLSNRGLHTALANPESLTELLRVSTLRSDHFDNFSFTRALCQGTANALMEGTALTSLMFTKCSFSAEESAAIMASGLGRTTSISSIQVTPSSD
jgi:hypothetical protein